MSGFNFTIPATLLAGLYKDTLIASEGDAPAVEKPVQAPIEAAVAQPAASSPPVMQPAPAMPQPAPQAMPVQQAPPARRSFLGDNAKGILILVKDHQNVHLAEDSLQLLSGILAACRLNMGDVAVMNLANQSAAGFGELRQQMQVNYCFLFDVGVHEIQLAFAIPQYQVFTHDNCTFLCAPAISRMLGATEDAKLLKSKLWMCLKKIFNV